MSDDPGATDESWAEQAQRAFSIVEVAPEHYRELLRPLVLQAMHEPRLRPCIDLLTTDAFFKHLLAERAPEPFFDGLVWVDKSDRLPTEIGVYVTMNRMLGSPRLLRLEGSLDRHWEWVTHWLGPIPVCGG